MKWDKPNGPVQHTSDERYCVVHATENNWIAYELTPFGTGRDLGTAQTDESARALCEDAERRYTAGRAA